MDFLSCGLRLHILVLTCLHQLQRCYIRYDRVKDDTRSQQYDIDEKIFQCEGNFAITDDDCIYLSVIEQGSGGVHV
jgi:hypothetical protein